MFERERALRANLNPPSHTRCKKALRDNHPTKAISRLALPDGIEYTGNRLR